MTARLCVLVVVLAGCATTGASAGIATGMIVPLGPAVGAAPGSATTTTTTTTGAELRAFVAGGDHAISMPNTYGYAIRQIGEEHMQQALQLGWSGVARDRGPMVYGRLMFDLIGWQKRMDGDNSFTILSPTAEIGVAPWGKGLCVSASATWDVHFNAPDRAIVGAFVGLCGAH